MHPPRALLFGFALLATLSTRATAQSACTDWDPLFRAPGVGLALDWAITQVTLGSAADALVFDDGSGPALYVGGDFTSLAGAPAKALARRRAGGWETVGTGPLPLLSSGQGRVEALAEYTNGSVPALFAALNDDASGACELGAWDGSSWTSFGAGVGVIHALQVYDDGSGPALYVGGEFTAIATLPSASRIARWTPAGWSTVGSGLSGGSAPAVLDFTIHDDGSGPALVVAGRFTSAGGVPGSCVARWNGGWSSFGGSFSNEVRAVTSYDDGAGARLYAGGSFSASGGIAAANFVRWDGSAWSAVPGLTSSSAILALSTSTATGAGAELLVGAEDAISFNNGGVPGTSYGCALWSGAGWSVLNPNPLRTPPGSTSFSSGGARAFADFDPGTGPRAYVLGGFPQLAGLGLNGLARWNGTTLEVDDAGQGLDWPADVVRELHYPTASDTRIFAAGSFLNAGSTPVQPSGAAPTARVHTVAMWDGISWTAMGNGLPNATVWDMIAYDPGSGPILFAATQSGLYRWNTGTSSWGLVSAPNGPTGVVLCLRVHNGFLYAGGGSGNWVRRWNGTQWAQLSGLSNGTRVTDLEVYDAGAGPELYACGDFTQVNSTPADFIARWDGTRWWPLPAISVITVNSLGKMTVYADGTGLKLIAAADTVQSGITATRVLSWDGNAWSVLGGLLQGVTSDIAAIDRFPAGGAAFPFTGSRLVVTGGYIPITATLNSPDVLEWDGGSWRRFGNCTPLAAPTASVTFGTGGTNGHPGLWLAGAFESMSGLASGGMALHRECAFQSFCAGDGIDPYVTTPCPCANFGSVGHGCNNKSGTGGAVITGAGDTLTPFGTGFTESVVLTCSGMNIPTTFAVFWQSAVVNPAGQLFGGNNGVWCVPSGFLRIAVQPTTAPGSGIAQYPQIGDPPILARSQAGGDPLSPGMVRYYFATYRDIQTLTGCAANTTNASNALAIIW